MVFRLPLIHRCVPTIKGPNTEPVSYTHLDVYKRQVIGRALNRYPRESYYLATKFPGYDLSNMDKVEEIFEKQLKKCGVD